MERENMVVRCYCCKKRFKSDLTNCPKCGFENLKGITYLPEELKIKHAENHKLTNTLVTISEIEQYVKEAANDCDFKITDLIVKDDFDGMIECMQAEEDYHKLQIKFNPKRLSHFTTKEIKAMLRHEIIHPITMKEASKIMVSDTNEAVQELQAAVQTAYDEMINYKEYSKRFPNDPDFHSAKDKVFTNFSIIILKTKEMLVNNQIQHDHPKLFVNLLAIYEDAVYYFFEKTEKMEKWVENNSTQAVYEFLKWIHEDLEMIQENISNRDEMREISFLTFKMIPTINANSIYTKNILEFNNMWNPAISACLKQHNSSLGTKLIQIWEKRFRTCPQIF